MTRLSIAAAAFLSVAFLSGSRVAQSVVEPAGPAAQTLSDLTWGVFILFSVVGVLMWMLLAWMTIRANRGTLHQHEAIDAGGGHLWIWIGGIAIPFVILAAVFITGLRAMERFPVHDGHAMAPAEIQIVGHQWWWEVHYRGGPQDLQFTTANEIHIPVGRAVDIDLTSMDVIHSFWVPRLNGKMDLIPGQNNRTRLEASVEGEYRGQCAEFCGAQHAHMAIVVIAEPEPQYWAWRARMAQDAARPATEHQIAGQTVFLSKPCVLCHEIDGTDAHGRVGPNLTHIANRRGLAGNMLRNDTANLSAWVTHAQSLKPGAQMPNVTQLTGEELQDLVAYLQHLH